MATNLRTKLEVAVEWTYRNIDSASSRTVTDANSISYVKTLANGVAIDTADVVWDDQRTVNAGADDDLDLAGGVTNSFGVVSTFVKVKALIIKNRNTTAGHLLTVGGSSAPFLSWLGAAGDIVKIGPDGLLFLANPSLAGYAVTATTGDILRLSGVSGNIVYDIAIIGTSA